MNLGPGPDVVACMDMRVICKGVKSVCRPAGLIFHQLITSRLSSFKQRSHRNGDHGGGWHSSTHRQRSPWVSSFVNQWREGRMDLLETMDSTWHIQLFKDKELEHKK